MWHLSHKITVLLVSHPLRTPLRVGGKGILATNACPQIARSEISPYRNTKPIGVHHIYMVKLPLSLPDKGGPCADPHMRACGVRWVRLRESWIRGSSGVQAI